MCAFSTPVAPAGLSTLAAVTQVPATFTPMTRTSTRRSRIASPGWPQMHHHRSSSSCISSCSSNHNQQRCCCRCSQLRGAGEAVPRCGKEHFPEVMSRQKKQLSCSLGNAAGNMLHAHTHTHQCAVLGQRTIYSKHMAVDYQGYVTCRRSGRCATNTCSM